jgi:hypothetical protein
MVPLTDPSARISIGLNKIIPHASSNTTTPSKVSVSGPFAFLSCIRSIFAAGSVAVAIPARIRDIAIPAPNINSKRKTTHEATIVYTMEIQRTTLLADFRFLPQNPSPNKKPTMARAM